MSFYSEISQHANAYSGPSVINIPADFPNLLTAMDMLNRLVVIKPITISIANGTYAVLPASINNIVDLTITGNIATPASVVFNYVGASSINVNNSNVTFQGVTVNGTGPTGANIGIASNTGSNLVVSNCVFTNLNKGVFVNAGGLATVNSSTFTTCLYGVSVERGSTGFATNCTFDGVATINGVGLESFINSSLTAINCTSNNYAGSSGVGAAASVLSGIGLLGYNSTGCNIAISITAESFASLQNTMNISAISTAISVGRSSMLDVVASGILNISNSPIGILIIDSSNATLVGLGAIGITNCSQGLTVQDCSNSELGGVLTVANSTTIAVQSVNGSNIFAINPVVTGSAVAYNATRGSSMSIPGSIAGLAGNTINTGLGVANVLPAADVAGPDGSVIFFS